MLFSKNKLSSLLLKIPPLIDTVPVNEDPGDGIVGDPYGFSLIDYFGVGGGPFLDSGFYGTDYPTYTTTTFTTPLAAYDLPMYLGVPEIHSVGSNPTPVAGQSSQPWTVDLYGQFLMLYDTDVVTGQQTPYPSTVVLNDSNGQPVQTQPTITAPQTDTDITLSVPATLPAGNYTFVVTTSIGWTVSTNFTVGDPTPGISGVSPPTWLAGQITNVTVQGSGFGTSPTVQLSPADSNVSFDTPVACIGNSTTDTCFTVNATVQSTDPGGAYNLTVTSQGYGGSGFFSGGTGNTATASASVNISSVLMKLEQVGPTVISTDGAYSEDTTIRVTAVDSTGATIPSFTGTVNIAENGTSIYSQNGGTLPSSVNLSSGGTTTFVAHSLAGPKVWGTTKPDNAQVTTTNYPVWGGSAVAIPQWVISPTKLDSLAAEGVYDWVQARAKDIFASATGDAATILGTISSYSITTGDNQADWQRAAQSPIEINPYSIYMRLDSGYTAICGHARNTFFTDVLLHEGRHTYIASLAADSENDQDGDFLLNTNAQSNMVAPNTIVLDTGDARTVCDEVGNQTYTRSYKGDNSFDQYGSPDYASQAFEEDAWTFAEDNE